MDIITRLSHLAELTRNTLNMVQADVSHAVQDRVGEYVAAPEATYTTLGDEVAHFVIVEGGIRADLVDGTSVFLEETDDTQLYLSACKALNIN